MFNASVELAQLLVVIVRIVEFAEVTGGKTHTTANHDCPCGEFSQR